MLEETESMTAKLCAFARAWHSNSVRDKIYDDYLAFDIMGRDEYEEIYHFVSRGFSYDKQKPVLSRSETEALLNEYISPIPLARIHFAENQLQMFAEEEEHVQYIICGAGSDTFSFRNLNPNIDIYEVDHPDTQSYKLERIRTLEWNIPENVHFVSTDFEKEHLAEKLIAAGFNPNLKTFISILGVSYYLTLPVFAHTFLQLSEIVAPGSVLVFDYPSKEKNQMAERVTQLEELTASMGEKMMGGFTFDELSYVLGIAGFQVETHLTPALIQETFFKNRQDNLKAFENVNLISAVYTMKGTSH